MLGAACPRFLEVRGRHPSGVSIRDARSRGFPVSHFEGAVDPVSFLNGLPDFAFGLVAANRFLLVTSWDDSGESESYLTLGDDVHAVVAQT